MARQYTHHATTGRANRKTLVLIATAVVVLIVGYLFIGRMLDTPSNQNKNATSVSPPTFNKYAFSTTDPASPWVIVNKSHPLSPTSYVPLLADPHVTIKNGRSPNSLQVSSLISASLVALFKEGANQGHHLMLSSAYRSYDYQVRVYNSIVAKSGQASADEQSAKPGYSEHQTGLAVDIAPLSGKCDLSRCFADTLEGQWVAQHAHEYGFIIRYPEGKRDITGYEFEPWHLRFVGKDLAQEMKRRGVLTLEEFFNVSGGTTYN